MHGSRPDHVVGTAATDVGCSAKPNPLHDLTLGPQAILASISLASNQASTIKQIVFVAEPRPRRDR